jgi:flagellar biosynthesis protein FliQ
MTERDLIQIAHASITIALQLSLPVLLVGLLTGVLVSLFQAVTQIQEFTLTFVPKLLAVMAVLVVLGPWMLSAAVQFIIHTYTHMPPITR